MVAKGVMGHTGDDAEMGVHAGERNHHSRATSVGNLQLGTLQALSSGKAVQSVAAIGIHDVIEGAHEDFADY